jgi:protein phosphatase
MLLRKSLQESKMNHYQSVVIQEMKSKALHLETAALTTRGHQRRVNEDAVFYHTDQRDTGESLGLFVLCDGMGGHEAGDVASQMTVQAVTAELGSILLTDAPSAWPSLHHWVRTAVAHANHKIWEYTQTPPMLPGTHEQQQSGTTITLTLICGNWAAIANVGDSRTYVWRADQLIQITHDHSLVTELVEAGLISVSSAATHPYRNILTRALGMSEDVAVDLFESKVFPGDKFLLCSDGVWSAFPDTAELAHSLDSALSPDDLCRQLIKEASRKNGADDMSVIAVYVNE